MELRDRWEYLDIDGRIILKYTLEKYRGNLWVGFIWLRTGQVAGCYEHDNEISGSINSEEFLD
jgi:hypothetical protein